MGNSSYTQYASKQHVGGQRDALLCILEALFTVFE